MPLAQDKRVVFNSTEDKSYSNTLMGFKEVDNFMAVSRKRTSRREGIMKKLR